MMRRELLPALAAWLHSGRATMGQVAIVAGEHGFQLCHVEDEGRTDLALHTTALAARQLALLDDEGKYRPLRTAPTLRHGWRLEVEGLAALREALEGFYPAMLGLLCDARAGAVEAVPLRATLDRQSGMYAITRKLTDEQGDALVGRFCRSEGGCLKTILWELSPGRPITSQPPEKLSAAPALAEPLASPWPLLCHEACNLLVEQARSVVKRAQAAAAAAE